MYQIAKIGVIRVADGKHILPDKSNPEWLAYLEWVKAGNIPAS